MLALGVRALAGQVENDSSLLQQITGVVGTAVSGVFLYIIGIINLVILIGIIKVFRRMRQGAYDEDSSGGAPEQPRLHEPDPCPARPRR